MTEKPQAQTSASDVPQQTRGQENLTTPQPAPPGAETTGQAAGQAAPAAAPQHRAEVTPTETTGWAGWVIFGSMMMIMVGAFQLILGLTALLSSDYYVVRPSGLVVNVNYTGWGWAHVILGAAALAAAFGLLAAKMWARVLGIGLAALSALVNLLFLAAFPLWAITVITLDVIVIYAIAVHGRELEDA
jgi:hypothetical protein